MNAALAGKAQVGQILTSNVNFDNEEVVNIGQYWRTIKRAKWSILAVTLCCFIIGVFIASSAVPVYKASTKILADPQQPNANRNEQYIASALVFLYYETQYEIIKSRNLAETVVEKLGLVERYKKLQLEKSKEPVSSLAKSIKDIKTEFAGLFSKNEPTVKTEPTDADLKIMLATGIQSGIAVSGGKQSQIINISYTSPDPKEAAEIINAISDAYIQFGLESRLGEVKKY
jgi:uncharacterized protein involved in exopolysaccharide biosynthesis